jgi:alkaline phosphatase D
MQKIHIFLTFILALWAMQTKAQTTRPEHLNHLRTGARAGLAPFFHGVASGDPLQDKVMIWTRITTDSVDARVKWRIASDTGMVNVLDSGMVMTDASKDFTVKIDVANLQPNHFYYYEFECYDKYSLRGRTKTLPVGDVDSLRFAVVSCSNYAAGFFNAYDALTSRNDFDAVLHLGDYIYEYGDGEFGSDRSLQPATEILTLSDYRTRHSYYKLDEDLIRLHQQYPFITVWDDHETANDSWFGGADNHTTATEGDWFDRKSFAIRAYNEWQPIRRPSAQDTQQIYRKFKFGDLLELYMLDTRLQAREEQNGIDNNPARQLMGSQQLGWLCQSMDTTSSQWRLLGQQVMMAPIKIPTTTFPFTPAPFLEDQWDGYPAERTRLYDSIQINNIPNMVVLTGDIHSAWANDLPLSGYNPNNGAGSIGVEFVVNSVTSQNFPFPVPQSIIRNFNNHVKFAELTNHGYMLVDINKNRTQCDWYTLSSITSQTYNANYTASWYVNNNERHLRAATAAAGFNPNHFTIFAPLEPRTRIITALNYNINEMQTVVLGVYPNPFQQQITLHYNLETACEVNFSIQNISGQTVFNKNIGSQSAGVQRETFALSNLPAGAYILTIQMGNVRASRYVVRQ